MNDIILINNNGYEIATIEELMLYVLDYYGNGGNYSDIESDFYSLLIEEDLVEDIEFSLDSLEQGYRILNAIEPNYWKIEEI